MSKSALIFFFTARVHTRKSTVKILAAKTRCKYFLKIAEITHFSVRGTACIRGLYNPSYRSQQPYISRSIQHTPSRIVLHIAPALLGMDISPRVWQVTILAMFSSFEKILAERISS
jgi:hypothetical protein